MSFFFHKVATAITFDSVTPLYNTIGIQHNFGGPTHDIPLWSNGAKQYPLIYNSVDGIHYGTVWAPEGTLCNLEIIDTSAAKRTASSTTLTTPTKPTPTRIRYVSPDVALGAGSYTDADPGNLSSALASEASGDEIILKQGTKPYYKPTGAIGSSASNVTLIAKSGENPVVSGRREAPISWEDESTGTHTGGTHATIMTDSTARWPINGLVGLKINNITDGSFGFISSNTYNTITATLTGGDAEWELGDVWTIEGMSGVWSTTDFDGDMKQLHAAEGSVIQRMRKYLSLFDVANANHGWTMDLAKHDNAGSHTEAVASTTVLTDSDATWSPGALVGRTITNITKSENGVITSNTSTTATMSAGLTGGASWELNDTYLIDSKLWLKLSSSVESYVAQNPGSTQVYIPDGTKNLLQTFGNGVWIEGIQFEFNGAGSGDTARGVVVAGSVTGNVVIKKCIFRHVRSAALRITDCSNILIEGCTFTERKQYLTFDDVKSGVEGTEDSTSVDVDNCDNVTIRNCTFSGHMDSLVFVDGGDKITEANIHNCTFTETIGETLPMEGVMIQCRRWSNVFNRTNRHLAYPTSLNGPLWVINDRCYNGGYLLPIDLSAIAASSQNATKFQSGTPNDVGVLVLLNNTFEHTLNTKDDYTSARAWWVANNHPMTFCIMRNNIWMTRGFPFKDDNLPGEGQYDIDWDRWFTTDAYGEGEFLWRWRVSASTYGATFEDFQTISGQEKNGSFGNPNLSSSGFPLDPIPGIYIAGITGNSVLQLSDALAGAQPLT